MISKEERTKRLSAIINSLHDLYPGKEHKLLIDKLDFLFTNFNLKLFKKGLHNGEIPQPHTGMTPSLLEDTHYFITCGSGGRALSILKNHKDKIVQTINPNDDVKRGLTFGIYKEMVKNREFNVGVFTTGMGPSSVEIVMGMDFLAVAPDNITVIRVGTAGTMQPHIRAGYITIITSAIRDESVTDKYVDNDYVPFASPEIIVALKTASHNAKFNNIEIGPKITKDSLQWEFGNTPLREKSKEASDIAIKGGVVSSSMESSVIYTLCDLYQNNLIYPSKGIKKKARAGTIVAIINDPPNIDEEVHFMSDNDKIVKAEKTAIRIAEKAIKILYMYDNDLMDKVTHDRFSSEVVEFKKQNEEKKTHLLTIQRQMRSTYRN